MARARTVEPDETTEPEPEPVNEPEPDDDDDEEAEAEEGEADDSELAAHRAPTPDDLERIGRTRDRIVKDYVDAFAATIGDHDPEVQACPLCQFPGFVFEQPGVELDPHQIEEVMVALGMHDPRNLPQDPRVERCVECQGRARVRTGSLDPDNMSRPCVNCGGTGYATRVQSIANTAPYPPNGWQTAQPGGPPPEQAWTPPPPPVYPNAA